MTVQRKRIKTANFSSSTLEVAVPVVSMVFDASQGVNIHGLRCTIGFSPFGPDETLLGRWYVVLLPASIAQDVTLRNEWISNLNTQTTANTFLDTTPIEVWGADQVLCAEQSVYLQTFAPASTRNAKKNDELFVITVVDAVSGVVDNFDVSAAINLFTS